MSVPETEAGAHMGLPGRILGVIRAPFLVLAPVCLAPAVAVAWRHGAIAGSDLALVLIAAVMAHIAVNALNEYEDFRSGLDFMTERTPFSGGSGVLVRHHRFAPAVFFIAVLAMLVTASIGLYFAARHGLMLLLPGAVGLALIVAYTRWINRLPLLCLLAPGIGFGVLMVNLAVLVLAGRYLPAGFAVSVPVTLLCCNLLLLNQLPDVEADRRVGRRHLFIAWGVRSGIKVYGVLAAGVYLSVLVAVAAGLLPLATLLAWLTLPVSVATALALWRLVVPGGPLPAASLAPLLARNVLVTLLTPVLLAVGIVLGG